MASVLHLDTLPVKKLALDTPPLEEICQALQTKLESNFDSVCTEVVDCPDLTQEPFNLVAKGINGNVSLLDVGGVPYLAPLANRDKVYDLRTIPKLLGEKEVFVIGAGAGPFRQVGVNSELIVNTIVNENGAKLSSTRISKMIDNDNHKVEVLPDTETTCSLLANLHCSKGEQGKVIKIDCRKRTGKKNFVEAIKSALVEAFPSQIIGLGGVFVVVKGKVMQHIMPDFSETPIQGTEAIKKWLKRYEMSAPLSFVGTMVTKNPPDFDLYTAHFHGYGKCGGGHYEDDTTPEEIEYLAYFSLASILYKVDKPDTNFFEVST